MDLNLMDLRLIEFAMTLIVKIIYLVLRNKSETF